MNFERMQRMPDDHTGSGEFGNNDEIREELKSLTDLPRRNQEQINKAVEEASNLTEIKEVMETGWPAGPHFITKADREGYNKWDKFALEQVKRDITVEDILMTIASFPPKGASLNDEARKYIEKYPDGPIILAKFDKTMPEKLAENILRFRKMNE